MVTPFAFGPAKILPCPTNFDVSIRLFARGLFIAMTTEAERTSETSVYLNETTRRYIAEGCNLSIS
jgi:hypothetical protein